jgi:hypothetical protein
LFLLQERKKEKKNSEKKKLYGDGGEKLDADGDPGQTEDGEDDGLCKELWCLWVVSEP